MLSTALVLAQKDLRLFARDRTALLLTFLLPIVLGSVFGTAMQGMGGGGGGGSSPRVELVVEDRDGSDTSRALVAALEAARGLTVERAEDARGPVANGKRACGLVVPEGYGAGIAAGEVPELTLLRDPSRTISQQVVLFQLAPVLAQRQVDALGAGVMGRVLDLVEFPEAGRGRADIALRESFTKIEDVLRDIGATQPESEAGATDSAASTGVEFDPLEQLPRFLGLRTEDVAGRAGGQVGAGAGASHAFASMAVMMLLFSVVGAGGTLLQERAEGTLTRLQLTPSAGSAVLIGKLLSTGLIALLQLVVLFTFGALVFSVPVASAPIPLLAVSLAWVSLAVAIGLFFAVLAPSQKQLEGLSTLLILVMSAVGGAWFPREITPEWFRSVGAVTPVAWAMDAYHGVLWYGKGLLPSGELDGVGGGVVLMGVVAAVLLLLTFRRYRRRFVDAA